MLQDFAALGSQWHESLGKWWLLPGETQCLPRFLHFPYVCACSPSQERSVPPLATSYKTVIPRALQTYRNRDEANGLGLSFSEPETPNSVYLAILSSAEGQPEWGKEECFDKDYNNYRKIFQRPGLLITQLTQ